MILFFISCTTLQIHSMEIEKLNNKESTSRKLLTAMNTTTRETIESPTKYYNNYVPSLPTTISSTHQNHSTFKEKEIKDNELHEVITFRDSLEKSSSQEYQTTDDEIATMLTTKDIDINLDNDNRRNKNLLCLTLNVTLLGAIITGAGCMAGFFIWLITNPETWNCHNRTHLPPCEPTYYSWPKLT